MKTTKMSSQQATYAKAKAIYDTLNAERLARYAALPGFETEEEIDARCAAEIAIDEELDFFAVETELREAEKALLEWGHAQARRMPGYSKDIDAVFSTRSVVYQQKAIDLCFRLAGA